MPSFFETMEKSFADVSITVDGATKKAGELDPSTTAGEIDTQEFLKAATDLVRLFDILGSTAFGPVKADMNGNIKKIHDRYSSHPEQSKTLQSLVGAEAAEKKKTATEGLLWLTRGLEFTKLGLQHNVKHESEELSVSFTHAYGETLKQHHNFVVKGIFGVAMKACPYRDDFYPKLHDHPEERKVHTHNWLTGLEVCVSILKSFDGIKESSWKGYK